MKSAIDVRQDLVNFVVHDLVGPAHGEDEVLEDDPKIRYSAGVLFPQETMHDESSAVSGVEGEDEGEDAESEVIEGGDVVELPGVGHSQRAVPALVVLASVGL